jgi:hypothetical protein
MAERGHTAADGMCLENTKAEPGPELEEGAAESSSPESKMYHTEVVRTEAADLEAADPETADYIEVAAGDYLDIAHSRAVEGAEGVQDSYQDKEYGGILAASNLVTPEEAGEFLRV